MTANFLPCVSYALTRRSALRLGFAGLVLPRFFTPRAQAAAQEKTETHGLSIFGDLAQPAGFRQFPYVNPDAPKGGEIVLQVSSTSGNQNFTTFNTLNTYILKGDGAAGMGLIFDSLMSGSGDEPDSLYGLVARAVRISADKTTYRFLLRNEARFHDGSPLTAHDVAFSLNIPAVVNWFPTSRPLISGAPLLTAPLKRAASAPRRIPWSSMAFPVTCTRPKC